MLVWVVTDFTGSLLWNGIFCEQTVIEFTELQPAIEFSVEKESWNLICFLDLAICQENNFSTYQNPTQTLLCILPYIYTGK
jgi:hypothetical protein